MACQEGRVCRCAPVKPGERLPGPGDCLTRPHEPAGQGAWGHIAVSATLSFSKINLNNIGFDAFRRRARAQVSVGAVFRSILMQI